MPRRVQGPNGIIQEFPDDATDDEIAAALGASNPAPVSSQIETLPESRGRSPVETALGDAAIGAVKGAAGSVVDVGEVVSKLPGVSHALDAVYGPAARQNGFDWARSFLKSENTAQSVGKGIEKVAEIGLPVVKGASAALNLLPNAARAGKKFQSVMAVAGDMAVNVEAPALTGLRVAELAERGASMPKAVKNFLTHVTDAETPAMTYRVARDFASNLSRLSSREYARLTPVVAREVATMSKELNAAIAQTAKQAGKLDEYYSAMREYARAKKIQSVADAVLQGAKGSAPYLGAAGAGAWTANKLKSIVGQ